MYGYEIDIMICRGVVVYAVRMKCNVTGGISLRVAEVVHFSLKSHIVGGLIYSVFYGK